MLSDTSCCAVANCPAHSVPSEQLALPRFPGVTDAGDVLLPLQNKVSPATEAIIGICAFTLYVMLIASAMRPAQPVCVTVLCAAFCHSNCWSGCENRFDGVVTLPPRYVVRVVGWIRVPTLDTMAALPLLYRACSSGIFGFSAKLGVGVSGSSAFCASASGPRRLA